jgi:hypothetical protein
MFFFCTYRFVRSGLKLRFQHWRKLCEICLLAQKTIAEMRASDRKPSQPAGYKHLLLSCRHTGDSHHLQTSLNWTKQF